MKLASSGWFHRWPWVEKEWASTSSELALNTMPISELLKHLAEASRMDCRIWVRRTGYSEFFSLLDAVVIRNSATGIEDLFLVCDTEPRERPE